MNIERFHNQLALSLGYDRIVNKKQVTIMVDESEDPMVTLSVPGNDDISFKASESPLIKDTQMFLCVKEIVDAVHQSYIKASNNRF